MNQDNSPEHVYDCPNVVEFELQEKSPVYYTTIKSGIDRSVPSSHQKPIRKSSKATEKCKPVPEHKTQNINCNKVTAAVIVVTCLNILLALCGLVAAVYAIVSLRAAEIAPTAAGETDSTTSSVQMLFFKM